MDNFFIARQPLRKSSPIVNLINKCLRVIKAGYQIHPLPDPVADMNTIEQRINYFHLLDAVIGNEVAGDIVELGCFTGQCAMLFQQVIEMNGSDKKLHLYDSFQSKFRIQDSIEPVLLQNFRASGLQLPILHKGYFDETIPSQLPEHICFVHIDCGSGGNPDFHKNTILHCLNTVYPRLSKGGICAMMDYHDSSLSKAG